MLQAICPNCEATHYVTEHEARFANANDPLVWLECPGCVEDATVPEWAEGSEFEVRAGWVVT